MKLSVFLSLWRVWVNFSRDTNRFLFAWIWKKSSCSSSLTKIFYLIASSCQDLVRLSGWLKFDWCLKVSTSGSTYDFITNLKVFHVQEHWKDSGFSNCFSVCDQTQRFLKLNFTHEKCYSFVLLRHKEANIQNGTKWASTLENFQSICLKPCVINN